MFSNSSTKTYPVAVRYPKRTTETRALKTEAPIATNVDSDADDSTCSYREAFRIQRKEERYLIAVTMIPLAILFISAFSLIAYLILNPDAFMVPIAP